ncbi:phage shock protein B [Sphingomonas sp. KRR8]|uniref:phage shock protein B n=1 Tax=Sphingomonas sp. KRR8 TaxID=2942996 RepID=UPI0020209B69|nr:phage shock protein B [Sphingomonas sp. KRR8]URD61350.1 phage shock protein B [Sphingomonas sp. KRR8]
MNAPEFILAIIVITGIFSIIRARMGLQTMHSRWRDRRNGFVDDQSERPNAEAARLTEEVRQLKERIQVLERITVDKENSLARQIDELRDR